MNFQRKSLKHEVAGYNLQAAGRIVHQNRRSQVNGRTEGGKSGYNGVPSEEDYLAGS
jgi:hypothetical protein